MILEQCFDETMGRYRDEFVTIPIHEGMGIEEIYILIYKRIKEILDDFHKRVPSKDKTTDIKKLITLCGIEIIEKSLTVHSDQFCYKMFGYLAYDNYVSAQYQWKMYVNKTMSSLNRRYAMAHQLAYFLLKKDKCEKHACTRYDVYPFFSKNPEELLSDIITSFLLMPLDLIIEIMKEYLEQHQKKEMDAFGWIQYLGNKVRLSNYHTVMCYQNIRYLAEILAECSKKGTTRIGNGYDRNDFKDIFEKLEQCPELFR